MATQTTNLNLIKPDKTDFYNIDDFNNNMDKIDTGIQEMKPKVIGDSMEGEWKRATIVIPELEFTHSEGSSYNFTGASVTFNDYISEEIQDVIVVNVFTQGRTFATGGYTTYDIGCYYCSLMPDGKWKASLLDREKHANGFNAFTVIDVLYRV